MLSAEQTVRTLTKMYEARDAMRRLNARYDEDLKTCKRAITGYGTKHSLDPMDAFMAISKDLEDKGKADFKIIGMLTSALVELYDGNATD